jgi:PAS domain S-box-containing protein
MSRPDTPIRRRLMRIMLMTSGLVLLLTSAAFLTYELLTYRQAAIRELSTIGRIIAANSTASLAFQNPEDAREVMAGLKAEPNIEAAALYDGYGRLFAMHPDALGPDAVPTGPQRLGFSFEGAYLVGFEPVVEGDRRLGTLYLRAGMSGIYQRLWNYAGIALLVMAGSLLAAYAVARKLQSQISAPILALAETATAISDRRDYSVRAPKLGHDELGRLTDAFNQMLTRIHQQNRELKESEGRVRAVVNSALSAVVVADPAGLITDWNARAEEIFGLRREEALGRQLEQTLFPTLSRKAYRRAVEQSLELANGDGTAAPLPIELTALHRDGSEFPVELAISPLHVADQVNVCSFITDITERKRADDRLHAQLARHGLLNRITRAIGERQDLGSIFQVVCSALEDDMPIAFGCVCLYDASRETLAVSGLGRRGEAAAAALDMSSETLIPIDNNGLSRCLRGELVYEPDTAALAFAFPQRLARQGLRSLIVAPLLLESHVFGVLVAARRESHGFSSPDCEFLRQLSEHVALAAHQSQIHSALQRAYDDLRQSQQAVLQHERLRALGEMASGIAHDINNAISPISLYTQLLLDTEPQLSATARESLETIDRAIVDVAATVARMREFYRPREPNLTLTSTSLNNLARQVLHLTRARWSDMPQERGAVIETVTDLAADLPPIAAAENEIREALTNLIFNAVDAMPDGGTLTIRTWNSPPGAADHDGGPLPGHVHIEVKDTGRGMDEETRRRCLEPFFTTKGERGTGLGLAMVYGIVQRHSADIEIESTPGQGTAVRMSFASASEVLGTDQPGIALALPGPSRILLVDDDPLLLKSLRDTLEKYGHQVTTAGSGQTGIETFREALARTEPFDLVITDLGMPYVDGRQVARAVKQMSSTPVLMLTGWGQRMADEGDIPDHVDRVLSKPPRLRELNAALMQYGKPG